MAHASSHGGGAGTTDAEPAQEPTPKLDAKAQAKLDKALEDARMHTRMGKNKDAIKAYDRALAIDPNNLSVQDARAWALLDAKRFDEAVTAFQPLVEDKKYFETAIMGLAKAHTGSGDKAAAEAAYKQYLANVPNGPMTDNVIEAIAALKSADTKVSKRAKDRRPKRDDRKRNGKRDKKKGDDKPKDTTASNDTPEPAPEPAKKDPEKFEGAPVPDL